ncbi:MAG: 23S rRNA (uracil(1939)-C(5))-methyltransferase RlmD [Gammaproteobacteria bacterium]|nr:23S rRNA (uracil(1939)-C(5))-methyltransferase RlmD [Gammaproteobacteria bacterium]
MSIENTIKKSPKKIPTLNHAVIDSMSHEGRGIAHINNKTTFIENALTSEEVNFIYNKQHSKFNTGIAVEILKASSDRVPPICKHFNICGGCTLQHLDHQKQIRFKTSVIQEQLKHIGGIETKNILSPILGPESGYRGKARLSVKYVHKKQKVLVGFHEKNGSYVAEIDGCPILHPSVGERINLLKYMISKLSIYQYIPQIEVACGSEVNALVLRNLQNFSDDDIKIINDFSKEHQLQIYSQSGGMETITPITSDPKPLNYKLPKYDLTINFEPGDFTQINHAINLQLVDLVVSLLEIKPEDKVLDLFCGIGNFTLPIATKCSSIVGIEGNKNAVLRAKQNAIFNNINNAEFYTADLTKELSGTPWSEQQYEKVLLDPPRTGAQELCAHIKKFGAKKIVYVSCNPATFARDAKIITEQGYKLENITMADMYPHTSHMETIAIFA